MVLRTAEVTGGETAPTPRVVVNAERCAGCQECVVRCPAEALDMDPGRWIARAHDDRCVGCRQCERTCPFGAIAVEGPMLVDERLRLVPLRVDPLAGSTVETRPRIASWGEALAEAGRCLSCPDPTCVKGCPAHNDVPSFIGAIRDRDLDRAHEILRRTSIFPDICSRVCDQSAQCEGACSWSLAGGVPVAIGALERFVTEEAPVPGLERALDREAGPSVAIVGAGPAGLAAAWELVAGGARVSVFEKDDEPLGVLRWGIPSFTLPDAVARRPVQALREAGVELRTGVEVGAGEVDELLGHFDAVVLAHGASLPLRPPVPGADLAGVEDATSFLSRAKTALEHGGRLPDLDETTRVLVLGAGNTAMDTARTARRLGAGTVLAIDWMDRRFARVRPDELDEAEAEGVEVRFLASLERLEGRDGRVARAWLVDTRQRRAGATPRIRRGSSHPVDVDLVIFAMGYRVDPSLASAAPGTPIRPSRPDIPDRRWVGSGILAAPASAAMHGHPVGRLALERETSLARAARPVRDRVWVVGDALTGPGTVVAAMAHGRRAARARGWAAPRRAGGGGAAAPEGGGDGM